MHLYNFMHLWEYVTKCHFIIYVLFFEKKDILLHSYKTTKIHFSTDTILIVSLVAQW